MLRFHSWSLSLALALGAGSAFAQDYPNKPLRIVTGGAGSGNDVLTRLFAAKISTALGQPVIVDNRIGTVGVAEAIFKAPPDGYTMGVHGGGTWLLPLMQEVPYDIVRDSSPVSLISRDVNVIAVHPALPVKTIKELIAYAKAKPGELNYGSGSSASTGRLATELFRSMTGTNMTWIPYKGSGPAVIGLVSGQVQVLTLDAGLLMPLAKAGKVRVLAVTSADASAQAPDVPTVAASGVPGYESLGRTVLTSPAKTPAFAISRVNQELGRYLRSAEGKEALFKLGAEATPSTPEEMAAAIRAEVATLGKLIRELGITAN